MVSNIHSCRKVFIEDVYKKLLPERYETTVSWKMYNNDEDL